MTTRTKANLNSETKRRVLATVLSLAADAGHGDGATYADCVACGHKAMVGRGASDPDRLELGHVTADWRGGEYWPTNLLAQCRTCNVRLGERDMAEAFTLRYDTRGAFTGRLADDPGARSVENSDKVWLPLS